MNLRLQITDEGRLLVHLDGLVGSFPVQLRWHGLLLEDRVVAGSPRDLGVRLREFEVDRDRAVQLDQAAAAAWDRLMGPPG